MKYTVYFVASFPGLGHACEECGARNPGDTNRCLWIVRGLMVVIDLCSKHTASAHEQDTVAVAEMFSVRTHLRCTSAEEMDAQRDALKEQRARIGGPTKLSVIGRRMSGA